MPMTNCPKGVFSWSFIILYNTLFTTPPIVMTAFMDQPPKKPEKVQIDPRLLNHQRLRKTSSAYFDRRSSSLALPPAFRTRAQSLMVVMKTIKPKKSKTQSKNTKYFIGNDGRKRTPYFLPRLTPVGLSLSLLKGVCVSAVLVWFSLGKPKEIVSAFSHHLGLSN
eukprot:TRINITY_DN74412_c0_g1_i1.p1 TRINITY_DN74412_c0_g1~~TRINITY_DN74412_c0_g1_i1.p1  ORF type:complete len:165 (-),score=16.73 TRINITY_DN74412_c0_g1_i1:549-1043(-)